MPSSALRERLARITPGRHQAPSPGANPELQALIERVERLRRRARDRTRPVDDGSLAAHLAATVPCPGLLLIERRYPPSHAHGRVSLRCISRLGSGTPGQAFLDTETSGLAPGTGTIAFMVGTLGIQKCDIVIRQHLLTGFGAERELLLRVSDALQPCSTLVSFNGKSFDVPLLAARYRLHGLPSPLTRLEHHDMLHVLRKRHGRALPDCRLKTAEAMLLGFSRRDDLPGSEAPQAWRKLVTQGEASQIPALLRHNRDDLLSLAALYWMLSENAHPGYGMTEFDRRPVSDVVRLRFSSMTLRSPRSRPARPAAGPYEASAGSRPA